MLMFTFKTILADVVVPVCSLRWWAHELKDSLGQRLPQQIKTTINKIDAQKTALNN